MGLLYNRNFAIFVKNAVYRTPIFFILYLTPFLLVDGLKNDQLHTGFQLTVCAPLALGFLGIFWEETEHYNSQCFGTLCRDERTIRPDQHSISLMKEGKDFQTSPVH